MKILTTSVHDAILATANHWRQYKYNSEIEVVMENYFI